MPGFEETLRQAAEEALSDRATMLVEGVTVDGDPYLVVIAFGEEAAEAKRLLTGAGNVVSECDLRNVQ